MHHHFLPSESITLMSTHVLVCIPKCCSISYFLPVKSEVFLVKKTCFLRWWTPFVCYLNPNVGEMMLTSGIILPRYMRRFGSWARKKLFTLGSPIGGPFFWWLCFGGCVHISISYVSMWQSIKVEDLHQWFGLYKDKRFIKNNIVSSPKSRDFL